MSANNQQVANCSDETNSPEMQEIIDGLRAPEKMISPKYFYDERGS